MSSGMTQVSMISQAWDVRAKHAWAFVLYVLVNVDICIVANVFPTNQNFPDPEISSPAPAREKILKVLASSELLAVRSGLPGWKVLMVLGNWESSGGICLAGMWNGVVE